MLPEGQHFSRAHASRSDRQPLITALSKKKLHRASVLSATFRQWRSLSPRSRRVCTLEGYQAVLHRVDDACDGAYLLGSSMCTILLLCAPGPRFWVVVNT
jgi:hypothetical protein